LLLNDAVERKSFKSVGSRFQAQREPITGVCGGAYSGVQGGKAPNGGSGGGKAPPLKLNAFLFLRVQRKLQICTIIDICKSQ